jgi:predicted RNase H-like HicB family nuclease
MLMDYLRTAMSSAHYKLFAGEGFYGEIPGFEGVFADGKTLEACREELASTLEDWILFRISRNLFVPEVAGMNLQVNEVAAGVDANETLPLPRMD